MDLKTSRRNVLGILIITLIFGIFSVLSLLDLFENKEKDNLVKSDYMTVLEKELGIQLNQNNDFDNFLSIEQEMLVVPNKYRYYYKPCFDFVIVKGGVMITNRLAKEFDELGFEIGMKITKVDDTKLEGKSYFEILELMYAKNTGKKKIFFHQNGQIEYTYKGYNDRLEYDQEENILYIYNLDNVSSETIHNIYTAHPDLVIDLSMATVNTYNGVKYFVSMFSKEKESLFLIPEKVLSTTPRKITNVKIVLGDNQDDGILFALTCIRSYESNVKIVRTASDVDGVLVNNPTFNALKTLSSSSHTIYLKNSVMKAKVIETGGDVV